MLVNFPHNPTATVVEREFYVDLVRLAKKYGFMVVSDLAYADIVFDGYKTPSFLSVPGALDVGVEMTTMSKSYSMAGWRIGFCCGNSEMVRALATIKTYYDYGAFSPLQIAGIVALRELDAYVENQAKIYENRRNVLCDALERIGWDVVRPKASMFVWQKIPERYLKGRTTLDFAMQLLQDANVVVSPGSAFGPLGEGYLRLAVVENEDRLRQAVRQKYAEAYADGSAEEGDMRRAEFHKIQQVRKRFDPVIFEIQLLREHGITDTAQHCAEQYGKNEGKQRRPPRARMKFRQTYGFRAAQAVEGKDQG